MPNQYSRVLGFLKDGTPVIVDSETGKFYSYIEDDISCLPLETISGIILNYNVGDNKYYGNDENLIGHYFEPLYIETKTRELAPREDWPFYFIYYCKTTPQFRQAASFEFFKSCLTTPEKLSLEIRERLYSGMGFDSSDIEKAKSTVICDLSTMLYVCSKINKQLFHIRLAPGNRPYIAYSNDFYITPANNKDDMDRMYLQEIANKTSSVPYVYKTDWFAAYIFGILRAKGKDQELGYSKDDFMKVYHGDAKIDVDQCTSILTACGFSLNTIFEARGIVFDSMPIMIRYLYETKELRDCYPHFLTPRKND